MTGFSPRRRPFLVGGSLLTALVVLPGCGAPATEPVEPPAVASVVVPETARSSDAVVNSIGVELKLTYLQTVYGSAFSSIIKPRLIALGVRHVRDEGVTAKSDGWMSLIYGRMKELAQKGIKFNLTMRPAEGVTDFTQITQWERFLSYALPVVEDFEGINEWDLKARSTTWPAQLRPFQQALYAKVTTDARTRHMPVFLPSMGNPNNASLLGDLSAWGNYGNTHPYPGGNQPMANVAYHATRVKVISGTRPWVVTETGYHNALAWTGGHPPVTERAAARYIPRLFLEYFDAGIRRTYLHELIDEGVSTSNRELNFGLLRNNGSPKPAYTALQNMITILKDPGPAYTMSQLGYTLGGDQTNLKRMLLQKRNGVFYLALWQAVSSYDLVAKKDLAPPARSVTVTFPAAVTQVRIFSPLTSAAAIQTIARPTTLTVSVPDSPVFVEITR